METHLADFVRGTAAGDSAEAIIRKCVHCGFCNATCPPRCCAGRARPRLRAR